MAKLEEINARHPRRWTMNPDEVWRAGRRFAVKDGYEIPLASTPAPICHGGSQRVLPWRYTDPGAGDDVDACVPASISIALKLPYADVERTIRAVELKLFGAQPTGGYRLAAAHALLANLGWHRTRVRYRDEPCCAHLADLPSGRLIVAVDSPHFLVVDDHTVMDTFNTSDRRFGRGQCVLSYWQKGIR